jgi:hypothetical protein
MAIQIKFQDFFENQDYIECKNRGDGLIELRGTEDDMPFLVVLDIKTAIKFAKTIRTEINKAKAEVENA